MVKYMEKSTTKTFAVTRAYMSSEAFNCLLEDAKYINKSDIWLGYLLLSLLKTYDDNQLKVKSVYYVKGRWLCPF